MKLTAGSYLLMMTTMTCFASVFLLFVLGVRVAECKEWTDEELRKLEKQWAVQDGEEVSHHLSSSLEMIKNPPPLSLSHSHTPFSGDFLLTSTSGHYIKIGDNRFILKNCILLWTRMKKQRGSG